jgi:hypothetical protein
MMQRMRQLLANIGQGIAGLHDRSNDFFYSSLRNRWANPGKTQLAKMLKAFLLFAFFTALIVILAAIGYNLNFDLHEAGLTTFRSSWVLFKFLPLPLLKFFFLPVLAFAMALFASASFVQDVYDLDSIWQGLRHIVASMSGFMGYILIVDEGEVKQERGKTNPLQTVGGPGWVIIRPGNVVQFRQLRELTNTSTELKYYLSDFERIELSVSLEDQVGHTAAAKMETLDGIRVVFNDIRYGYRIRPASRDFKRSLSQPFSFSRKALEAYLFERSVDDKEYRSWRRNISFAIDGPIMQLVNSNPIDFLMAPGIDDMEVRRRIREFTLRRQPLSRAGAELLWIDIGAIQAETFGEEIDSKRLERWAVDWKGDAEVIRAYGEANRRVLMERARANAQAEIITSIANSFELIGWQDDEVTNLRSILLSRTTQLIERLLENDMRQGGESY